METIDLDDDDFEFDDDDDDDDDDDFKDDNEEEEYEEEDEKDEDEEEEDDDVVEVGAPPTKKRATRANTTPKSSPKKIASKSPAKKIDPVEKAEPVKSKPTKKSGTSSSTSSKEDTAQQILATIPDAELPNIDEKDKLNYFQLKALQTNTNTNTSSSIPISLPEARANCLAGFTIVFTGQMPNLDRNYAESTAQRYGAKVTKSISKNTSFVVIGADAGWSKVDKIKKLGTKTIDEDGFLQLLEKMPEDGGSGEAAQKAKLAREEQERKVIEDAEKEERLEREEAEARERKRRKELENSDRNLQSQSSSGSSQLRMPPEPKQEVAAKDKLWTDKHAPKDFSQLCGNKGQVKKLKDWLENWFEYKARGFNMGKDSPGNFRAALISGPPGIGKTTAAHMVANSLGFDVLEKNASDVRSKSLLNSTIKSILGNTSVVGFFKHRGEEVKQENSENNRKICLIMDEVDGMSSGDHGGAGALSQFCRITNTPLILICNDKSLPKMRTFDKVTYDLPFRRPTENEVRSRLMTIALREGVKLDPSIIGQLVQATSNDIRQMINLLSTVSKTQKHIGALNVQEIQQSWKKQVILKPFDIAGRLLSLAVWTAPKQNLNEKLDLYFNDIDFAPLMIQENYLNTRPRLPGSHIRHVAQAADDISSSDSVNSLIRSSEQQWSLLPFHGLLSSVKPSYEVAGQLTGRINFSAWLGQNSKQMKFQRMLQELQYHTRIRTSTTKQELRLDYMNPLWVKLNYPLKKYGKDGIDETIETMDEYYLTKEDFDNIGEMLQQAVKLDQNGKTAFTRKYNNGIHPTVIYKTGNSLLGGGGGGGNRRGGGSQKVDFEDVVDDDMEDVADDGDDNDDSDKIDLKKDKLIKEKKKSSAKRSSASSEKTKGAPARKRARK